MTTETAVDWMNPLNKLRFQKAFRSKAPQVVLLGGQVFNIDYYKKRSGFKHNFSMRDMAVVHPSQQVGYNPFVPMGRFDVKEALSSAWLD